MPFKVKNLKNSISNAVSDAGRNAFNSARERIKNSLNIDGLISTEEFLSDEAVREYPFGIYSDGAAIGFTVKRTIPNGFFKESDTREITTIFLPVPPAFVRNTGASYSTAELGPVSQAIGEQASNFLGGGEVDLKAVSSAAGQQVKKNLLKAAATVTNINIIGQLQKTSGIAINPNESVLFEKINFRTYQFTYNFMPRNRKESEVLNNIIKVFELSMLPEVSSEGAGFLEVPDYFQLNFSPSIARYMPSFLPTFLTDMSVTYNQNKVVYHDDGSPNEVALSLTFQENKILTRSQAASKYGINTSNYEIQ